MLTFNLIKELLKSEFYIQRLITTWNNTYWNRVKSCTIIWDPHKILAEFLFETHSSPKRRSGSPDFAKTALQSQRNGWYFLSDVVVVFKPQQRLGNTILPPFSIIVRGENPLKHFYCFFSYHGPPAQDCELLGELVHGSWRNYKLKTRKTAFFWKIAKSSCFFAKNPAFCGFWSVVQDACTSPSWCEISLGQLPALVARLSCTRKLEDLAPFRLHFELIRLIKAIMLGKRPVPFAKSMASDSTQHVFVELRSDARYLEPL